MGDSCFYLYRGAIYWIISSKIERQSEYIIIQKLIAGYTQQKKSDTDFNFKYFKIKIDKMRETKYIQSCSRLYFFIKLMSYRNFKNFTKKLEKNGA